MKETMSNSPKTCPECHITTEPIRLLDATEPSIRGKGTRQVDLTYAAPDARASFFLGQVPILGIVRGAICPNCGHILLYGEPHPT